MTPTDAQTNLAKLISCMLDIPLPSEDTFGVYEEYIKEYYDEMQKSSCEGQREFYC